MNEFTQEDLAIKSRLDRCTINRYENDLADHSLTIINIIANVLNINANLIYDDYLRFIASDFGTTVKAIRIKLNLT